MVLSFVVDGPPVPLARARLAVRRGKVTRYTPKTSAEYEERVAWLALAAMRLPPKVPTSLRLM
jgi:Holliday junction resolvase RusA-like endonuclease